jgi:glycosyltransferase involved in cell wall biosynthesis
MKISVISARYALSGVPLAQLRFARALASLGNNVQLIYGAINSGNRAPVTNEFTIVFQNKNRVLGMLLPLIKHFKENKPDLVFSAGDHLNAIVLIAAILSGSQAKISCSSRVTPFDTYSNVPFSKRWILKQIMRLIIRRANALTCVSIDMVKQYQSIFKNSPHVCIYNIIENSHANLQMSENVCEEWLVNKKYPVVIAAGNLVEWKGFSDLIVAFKHVLQSRKAKLIILGDGPLRNELLNLIDRLDLVGQVKLLGYVDNPLKYFKRADIFVLSSYVEGLPNVLVEAMMCGCTPVSTNCPTGPREVLQEGKYGYLVPVGDSIAMAEGIVKALDKPISISNLKKAINPFSEHEVIARHFDSLGLNQQ